MAKQTGKYGAVYLPTGAGTLVENENVDITSHAGVTAYRNIKISKVTSDAGGNTPIYDWYYTTDGYIYVAGATDPVYVTYRYYDSDHLQEVGSFYEWSIDLAMDMHDVTDFGGNNAKDYLTGLSTWTGTASKYWIDSETIDNYMTVGSEFNNMPFIMKFYVSDQSTEDAYFCGLGIINGLNPACPADGLVTGTISIQGTSNDHCRMYYLGFNELANERFSEGTGDNATSWTDAGDFDWSDADNNMAYTHSSGSGNFYQVAANRRITASPGVTYRFKYTYAETNTPTGLTIDGGVDKFVASTDKVLPTTVGNNVVYFSSSGTADAHAF